MRVLAVLSKMAHSSDAISGNMTFTMSKIRDQFSPNISTGFLLLAVNSYDVLLKAPIVCANGRR